MEQNPAPLTEEQLAARRLLVDTLLDLAPQVDPLLDRMLGSGDPKAMALGAVVRQIWRGYSGRIDELGARAEAWDPRPLAIGLAARARVLSAALDVLAEGGTDA